MATTYPHGYLTPPKQLTRAQLESRPKVAMIDPEVRRRVFAMLDAAREAGVTLGIGGAGRTSTGQDALFRRRHTASETDSPPCNRGVEYDGKCWTLNPGAAAAARPGSSYHELTTPEGTALALDMIGDMAWMGKNCDRFGMRDASDINDEPWHIQPVEVPAARRNYKADKHALTTFEIAGVAAAPARLRGPAEAAPAAIRPLPGDKSTIRRGDGGARVYLAQTILHLGASQTLVIPDGDFGAITETGVKNLQVFFQVPVTGEIDANTWDLLHLLACRDSIDEPG